MATVSLSKVAELLCGVWVSGAFDAVRGASGSFLIASPAYLGGPHIVTILVRAQVPVWQQLRVVSIYSLRISAGHGAPRAASQSLYRVQLVRIGAF